MTDIVSSNTSDFNLQSTQKLKLMCIACKVCPRASRNHIYCLPCYSQRKIGQDKKYCPECEDVLDIATFTLKTGYVHAYCQPCRNKKARDSYTAEKGRLKHVRRTYGLSKEEYEIMLANQGGVCACCGHAETMVNGRTKKVQLLSVDHCHATEKVRKLLCSACNILVGHLEEDPQRVHKALAYLARVQEQCMTSSVDADIS